MMLEKKDLDQIEKRGISEKAVERQTEIFKRGFPHANLAAPATAGNGILVLDAEVAAEYAGKYDQYMQDMSVMKFVPASGAATRMFKNVYEWRQELKDNNSPKELINKDKDARMFFEKIGYFAFYDNLAGVMSSNGYDIEDCIAKGDYYTILDFLLSDKGLNYGSLPKGLLKFHKYNGSSRTAFEEHLVEGALYGKNKDGIVNIHFTVSPGHIELFHNILVSAVDYYESLYNTKYNITFSVQDPSTDTLAVDPENRPFRDNDGKLLFRPGGHGALIHNLNSIEKDVVFIKNIDNVVPDNLKDPTVLYKKMLGGILLELREQVFKYQKLIEEDRLSDEQCREAVTFACDRLNIDPAIFDVDVDKQKEKLSEILHAPIRVCGMVKNEGEPGGGPFWVYDKNKIKGLQIVESSQINLDDTGQEEIFKSSTHFNPVDIACSFKNHKGEKYDLQEFIDPETGFISQKSKDGRPLKALELPGLWNGAMAKWITVFVEVPVITFNPVKTINDLLRNEHQ